VDVDVVVRRRGQNLLEYGATTRRSVRPTHAALRPRRPRGARTHHLTNCDNCKAAPKIRIAPLWLQAAMRRGNQGGLAVDDSVMSASRDGASLDRNRAPDGFFLGYGRQCSHHAPAVGRSSEAIEQSVTVRRKNTWSIPPMHDQVSPSAAGAPYLKVESTVQGRSAARSPALCR
jgi:hypothetical protein